MERAWEDQIALNSFREFDGAPLDRPAAYADQQSFIKPHDLAPADRVREMLDRDTAPLPDTPNREGYCGPRHYEFWLHGLRDYLLLEDVVARHGADLRSMLDIGCASGRVIRHFGAQRPDIATWGCDINAFHVEWCLNHLPTNVRVFQATSVPNLHMPDASVDLVTAFSVFSHIEAFETAWLMEIRRILRPGGLAYLTFHSETTLKNMREGWPLYEAMKTRFKTFDMALVGHDMPREKMIFRTSQDRSYSSNVFLHTDHVRRVWGRFFEVLEILPRPQGFQDVAILRRTAN